MSALVNIASVSIPFEPTSYNYYPQRASDGKSTVGDQNSLTLKTFHDKKTIFSE